MFIWEAIGAILDKKIWNTGIKMLNRSITEKI
jgi:hypothetical protein